MKIVILKNIVKRVLSRFPRLLWFIKVNYRQLNKSSTSIETSLQHEISKNPVFKSPDFFFVNVGSNDGCNGDPLYEFIQANRNWRGMFIEPVKYVFENLVRNYSGNSRFIFENVAISDKEEVKPFYFIKKTSSDKLPCWYDQVGSFSKKHILKNLAHISNLEDLIVCEEIKGTTIPNLCRKHFIQRIDLLHIDTEGFDAKILMQIDLTQYKPLVIILEHEHISSQEKILVCSHLARNGYLVKVIAGDYFATIVSDKNQKVLELAAEKASRESLNYLT
jgi:FkbM family methyltransferase